MAFEESSQTKKRKMTQTSPRKRRRRGKTCVSPSLLLGLVFIGVIIGWNLPIQEYDSTLLATPSLLLHVPSPTSNNKSKEIDSKPTTPRLSVEPLTISLDSKWKLWTEMNKDEQKEALDTVGVYLKKYGGMIMKRGGGKQRNTHGSCDLFSVGGNDDHKLCLPQPMEPCNFISFTTDNGDYAFDRALADTWKCRGFVADSVVEPPSSRIHPNVTFQNLDASMISSRNQETASWRVSMPRLRYFLGLRKIDVLNLQCEGCEVALARDVIREDPSFLSKVNQVTIQTHVTRAWINSTEHLYYFGLHFALLEEAGFQLEWSNVFGCSKRHEVAGCLPELEQYSFPCGYEPWPGHPNVVIGRSCHDFLWKRYPK